MASESDDVAYYSIYIDEPAIRDIDAISDFLKENAGELTMVRQRNILSKRIEKLNVFPNGHPICEIRPAFRVAHAGKYQIFFRVDETSKRVIVARVLHARQNVDEKIN